MIFDKNIFIVILLINICLYKQNGTNSYYINNNNNKIENAIYLIQDKNGTLSLEFKDIPFFNDKTFVKNKIYDISQVSDNYYYISQRFDYNQKIYKNYLSIDSSNKLIINTLKYFQKKDYLLWKIIPKINVDNQFIYYIQNKKTKRFLELNPNEKSQKLILGNITDISKLNENNEFKFIQLYKEVNNMNSNSSILENEPIDVLIKYIDLSDPNLNRKGIKQIPKDKDNDELKYCVRSILKNIPWIRKIFILMPNEEVKYFKSKDEISDKIVYVKDKDLIGFDSANNIVFLFNLYKMKQFGLSENFIYMDDDYFIGKPINKNEFFYEDKGEVFPALITADYYEINKEEIQIILKQILSSKRNLGTHSEKVFIATQIRALLFMYDIFGNDDIRYNKKLIEPAFTHNAIPMKISDIKEIHDLVFDKYDKGKEMLSSKERSINDLQFQSLYMAYVKNKYDRKVSIIHSEFYDLFQAENIIENKNEKIKLFVINTSSRNYKDILFLKEKQILYKLFPERTIYEKGKNNELFFNIMIKNSIKFISFNKTEITNNKTISERKNYYKKILDSFNDKINEIKFFMQNNRLNVLRKKMVIKKIEKMIDNSIKEEKIMIIMNLIMLFLLSLLLYIFFINKKAKSIIYNQIYTNLNKSKIIN